VTIDFDDKLGTALIESIEDARCVLAAVRDGVVARHVVVANTYLGSIRIEIDALGDGSVIQRRHEFLDAGCIGSELFAMRRDDAWFDACLAGDSEETWQCLQDTADAEQCLARTECPE
jgi:hypothetical protein